MEEVEKRIREADTCLADISESNPNVWFELGFAIAAGKPVVLVCLEKPDRRFPFDIQHRAIITYQTESARDFDDLKSKITARLKASIAARVTPPVAAQPLMTEGRLGKLAEASVVAEVDGLGLLENVALVTLAKRFAGHGSTIEFGEIQSEMMNRGFSTEEVTVAVGMLVNKKMIVCVMINDDERYPTSCYGITPAGMECLSSYRDKLRPTEEDIPF